MLGEEKRSANCIYLNIKDGAIVRHGEDGNEKRYSYVDGRLISLSLREREFRGVSTKYWYIGLQDDTNGERYSIGFAYASNTFKSIILQLASEDGIESIKSGSMVRIEPYKKDGYDKVQVWGEGIRLSWAVNSMPPIERTYAGERPYKDDTKRMELICSLASAVKDAINNKVTE